MKTWQLSLQQKQHKRNGLCKLDDCSCVSKARNEKKWPSKPMNKDPAKHQVEQNNEDHGRNNQQAELAHLLEPEKHVAKLKT